MKERGQREDKMLRGWRVKARGQKCEHDEKSQHREAVTYEWCCKGLWQEAVNAGENKRRRGNNLTQCVMVPKEWGV